MATMTHSDKGTVAPYASAALLMGQLAKPLFETAMTAGAILDPEDKTYRSWWNLRIYADQFLNQHSLRLQSWQQEDLQEALEESHRNAHPCMIDPPRAESCPCHTAGKVRSVQQLLAGAPENEPVN